MRLDGLNNDRIFAHSYQLCLLIFERTRTFPKYHRPTLGRRFEECGLDLSISTRMALFTAKDDLTTKLMHLKKISECIDQLRIIAQVAVDLNLMKPESYTQVCDLISEIGKETGGFKKFVQKSLNHPAGLEEK